VLAREQAFEPSELELLREWVGAWAHALMALRARRRRRLFGFGYRDTEGALPVRRSRWFRPGWFALLVLVAVAAIPVRHSVLAPGELVPSRPQIVRAPLDGVIDSFLVEPNQEVKKGQPLFRFDEALIQSRLEVAQQALATASAEYRQTMQQAVTDQRVRVQLSALAGRIEERRTEVAYLTDQLTRARVLAPQDGIALFDDPLEWIGKPVTIGERILRVAAANEVEIEAWLPIADAIPLPAGAPVQLFLNAQPLQPVSATLRFMAHEAVQRADGSFAYRVRATLDHETEHRVGLKGTARLQGATVPLVYWVLRRPIAALRTTIGF
jgi:multidrug efflux pump subunit AcrA (membrane-fusion protein)